MAWESTFIVAAIVAIWLLASINDRLGRIEKRSEKLDEIAGLLDSIDDRLSEKEQ